MGWLYPLFTTNNLTLIQKCGLDAYFFLRFLRMLLKIFFPAALLAIPVLFATNSNARGLYVEGTSEYVNQPGLNRFSISNIGPAYIDRLWAHCLLAIIFIGWFCYVVFKELRGYIRVRQAYLTSPQHRIRASATTVLVTGIPRKWLTMEALSGLYDVFPGGIRNIWINRNFDELGDKVNLRNDIAKSLEDAETVLVKLCRKKHLEAEKKKRQEEGRQQKTKQEKKQDRAEEDAAAERLATSGGTSAGDTHETPHGVQDILEEEERQHENMEKRSHKPFAAVGQGFDRVGHGIGGIGRGIGKFGEKVVGGVDQGFHKVEQDINRRAELANGFDASDTFYRIPSADGMSHRAVQQGTILSKLDGIHHNNEDSSHGPSIGHETKPPVTKHPYTLSPEVDGARQESPTSGETLSVPNVQNTRSSSGEHKPPQSNFEIQEPDEHKASGKRRPWSNVFGNNDHSLVVPSPQPHIAEDDDEFPLHKRSDKEQESREAGKTWTRKLAFWKSDKKDADEDEKKEPKQEYPSAIDKDWDEDQDEEPYWRRYIEPKDRETMRLPLFSPTWFPSIPLVGQKVDRIYHLRRELARLNLEIEADQNEPEKFPFMNSAFIQFNHQVAAHMCCQSLSHHIPQQMAPRLVEISPDDVIWSNMSMKWWERYLRTGIVLAVSAGLIVLYAVPVAFTSILSKVSTLSGVSWLSWLNDLNEATISIIQGLLPPILLSLILLLVPIIFRLLIQQQGVPTGSDKELGVQQWYFAFLFIQVFLVVTLSGGLLEVLAEAASDPGSIVRTIGSQLPKASEYFFSYLTVQALSNSASALVQVMALLIWFLWAPLVDSTARAKWSRQTTLNNVQWGTFFPPFTNFAVIGLIYSIIAPLMLVFMIFIFGLFWVVYRYNVMYVYEFRHDTGGLLFPVAINQLFVGIYFLELCLIGLFFTLTDTNDNPRSIAEAVIMIVVLVFTILYQWLLNSAFKPLFQYLPITLEDEAVIRDEQFAKAQASKFQPLNQGESEDDRDIQDVLEDHERQDHDADVAAEDAEKRDIARRRSHTPGSRSPEARRKASSEQPWHKRSSSDTRPTWKSDTWKKAAPEAVARLRYLADGKPVRKDTKSDPEAQKSTVGDVLFGGFADELEDLTPDERDVLVRYAFQHTALRARRPVVWIPRDNLGVSDDEIRRAKKMSTVKIDGEEKTFIWMSNEGTALDGKGRVVFRKSPPDFSNVDLVAL